MKRLIVRYNGEPDWDHPDLIFWEDGTPATIQDFERRVRGTESDPHQIFDHNGQEIAVEVGMNVDD